MLLHKRLQAYFTKNVSRNMIYSKKVANFRFTVVFLSVGEGRGEGVRGWGGGGVRSWTPCMTCAWLGVT